MNRRMVGIAMAVLAVLVACLPVRAAVADQMVRWDIPHPDGNVARLVRAYKDHQGHVKLVLLRGYPAEDWAYYVVSMVDGSVRKFPPDKRLPSGRRIWKTFNDYLAKDVKERGESIAAAQDKWPGFDWDYGSISGCRTDFTTTYVVPKEGEGREYMVILYPVDDDRRYVRTNQRIICAGIEDTRVELASVTPHNIAVFESGGAVFADRWEQIGIYFEEFSPGRRVGDGQAEAVIADAEGVDWVLRRMYREEWRPVVGGGPLELGSELVRTWLVNLHRRSSRPTVGPSRTNGINPDEP